MPWVRQQCLGTELGSHPVSVDPRGIRAFQKAIHLHKQLWKCRPEASLTLETKALRSHPGVLGQL